MLMQNFWRGIIAVMPKFVTANRDVSIHDDYEIFEINDDSDDVEISGTTVPSSSADVNSTKSLH